METSRFFRPSPPGLHVTVSDTPFPHKCEHILLTAPTCRRNRLASEVAANKERLLNADFLQTTIESTENQHFLY